MSTRLSGFSGETKTYVSVLSANASLEISGASRWLDASAVGAMTSADVMSMAATAAKLKAEASHLTRL